MLKSQIQVASDKPLTKRNLIPTLPSLHVTTTKHYLLIPMRTKEFYTQTAYMETLSHYAKKVFMIK